MNIEAIYKTFFFLLLLLPSVVSGQISKRGIPIQIQKLQSALTDGDLVTMPAIDNQKMRNNYSRSASDMLKPFHFAHSFEVSLTTKNSGNWYTDGDVNVWQLRIRSSGAYSLNLILDRYKLPEKARLFLVSAKTGEIKGAYTSDNNSDSQILAIEPLEGDELLVQYEEPVKTPFPGDFRIIKVSHDYTGITYKDHRPLGLSGACNVNVNCDVANGDEEVRDAVCRIIISGSDFCTGTLVNNTGLDGIPYLLTAYHCFIINGKIPSPSELEMLAQSAIFLFNYESPYCGAVDGDVSRSLSGSTVKASLDSLDFALLRLNNNLPYNYRPYLAGWNRKNTPPTWSMGIHHPLGDIKKVSIDQNAPTTDNFSSSYLKNGFWHVLRYEIGVTEIGSSGGPMFDHNKQLVGTLTGGPASCASPANDYFSKFALCWDHRKESSKQLKVWLDPLNSNVEKLAGMSAYTGKTLCKPFTNYKDNDNYSVVQIPNGLTKKGYWSGSNLAGYTEFAEQYKFAKNCQVQGITLGIAKLKTNNLYASSYINIQVYDGINKPETLLYSEKFDIHKFWSGAMNYLPFKNQVKTTGNFFVSFDISQLNPGDSLVVYMANRKADTTNSFYLKDQKGWSTYNSHNDLGNGSALLTELIACNIDDPTDIEELKPNITEARFFPNPITGSSALNVQTVDLINCLEDVVVCDLLGKAQDVPVTVKDSRSLSLNFSGKRPGIYFVHLVAGGRSLIGKVAYVP